MGRGALIVALALATALATGCGDETAADFPPAAEPAVSPAPAAQPEGEVRRLGGEIEGLAFDPKTGLLAAVAREPGELYLLDGATLRVREAVPVGDGSRHLQLAGPGGPILVPAQFEDTLARVALPGGEKSTVAVGESPHDVAVVGDRTFVGDEGGDTVSVVVGDEVVATVEAPIQPGAVEAAGGRIAVVAVAERVLSVYDADSLDLLGKVDAGVGPTHAAALGDRLFVADTDGDAIRTFDIDRRSGEPVPAGIVASVGEPYGLAVDARRERLWVTATALNEVVAYDVSGAEPTETERFPTVRQPKSIAVDDTTGAVFVASRTDGEIQRIDPIGGER